MIKLFILMVAFCLCTLSGVGDDFSFSADAEKASEGEVVSGTAEEEPVAELTKEEILTRIKSMSGYHPDVVALVPGLKAITGAEGAITYEYNGEPLDSQDRDTLFGVLRIVNSHVSWKNVERTQRQLRALKQIENQNRTDRMLRQQRQQSNR